jgi:hypothetical protein
VHFRSWKEDDDAKLLEIVSQTPRLQSLELSRDADYKSIPVRDVVSRFIGSPELLEKLVITGHKRREESVYGRAPDDNIDEVTKELAHFTFPRLRQLEVTRCVIPWAVIPNAPRLTILKLHTLPRTESVTAQSFFEALRRMPFLRSIDLVGTLPTDDQVGGVSPIALTALQTLNIKGTFAQLHSFLRRTQIPVEACPHLGSLSIL